ncbi:MAG: hypothetical protein ACI9XC_000535 [Gammaproteobacteria bacterium]|jgi:hypothetical protein
MVQGNILSLTLAHCLIASQTGLLAGAIASTTIIAARLRRQWLISLTLGITTAIIDFFIHPANFGTNIFFEAIITGAGAALISYIASHALRAIRDKYASNGIANNESTTKVND